MQFQATLPEALPQGITEFASLLLRKSCGTPEHLLSIASFRFSVPRQYLALERCSRPTRSPNYGGSHPQ